jgi:rhodanese-related sulfurtransferase
MQPQAVREIDVQSLARRLQGQHPTLLLDVRQPWEHALAALPGDMLIPLDQLQRRREELTPSDETLVVVYCHHGIRSRSAAAFLVATGLKDVVSLTGGIDAWSALVDPAVPRY